MSDSHKYTHAVQGLTYDGRAVTLDRFSSEEQAVADFQFRVFNGAGYAKYRVIEL